jgi:hypothetical protein
MQAAACLGHSLICESTFIPSHPFFVGFHVGAHPASDLSYSFELTASNQSSCVVDKVMRIEFEVLLNEEAASPSVCVSSVSPKREFLTREASVRLTARI